MSIPLPLVEVRSLHKFFGGLVAVSGLDMNVTEGEILGLIGPNGAGKSTVLNMIGGSLLPNKGKVIFKGEDITKFPPYRRAKRGIARLFQENILFGSFTVLENVLVGFQPHSRVGFTEIFLRRGSNRSKEMGLHKNAFEILQSVGLDQHSEELAINLPHGKRRLLGLAIALAAQPQLLLLDEPLTGMNAEEVEAMMAMIRVLRDEREITSIVVEHNLRALMTLCDRIVVMNFGAKLAEGLPGEIVENPAVIEAYLGTEEDVA